VRILIHGINFTPELTGIGKYTGEMAAWLASAGHEVRVVTAPPYYPDWQVWPGYHATCYTHEIWQDVRIWRTPLWVPARPSGLKRLLHLASFALFSFPVMLRQILWRPNVVWVVEPTLFCAPAALCVARLTGARAWLHVQDFEVDAAFALGLLPDGRSRRLVAELERWLMLRFDRVSTISASMLVRASAKGVAADRQVHFPNWVDLEAIQPLPTPSRYRAELSIPAETVVAMYSGNMGGKQGLEALAQAAALLQDVAGLVFIFCGNGAGRDGLIRQCAGLPNVRFMDLQPLTRLGELLAMADIHLLPQRADAAELVMPSKLTGILASGRPVVATAHPDTELANVVTGRGLVVPPEQPHAFAEAINFLAQDARLRARLGAAGRAYAEANLDRDAVMGRFEAELKKILGAED